MSDEAISDELEPFARFARVYQQAIEAGIPDANAMCLATVDADGRPSTRMVLLKGWDPNGFVFYTNLESRKAVNIVGNPHVSLTFFWRELELKGARVYEARDFDRAIELAASGRLPLRRLITRVAPLDGLADALREMEAGGEAMKILIRCAG